MERETKEVKDFDAKAFVEDCKKTLKLIDEYAMKEDLARNQRFEKLRKEVMNDKRRSDRSFKTY